MPRLFFLWAKHIIDRFEGFFVGCAVHFHVKQNEKAKFFWPLHHARLFVNILGASVDFTQKERDALPKKDDLSLN